MNEETFSKSMYASDADLYKAKAKYFEEKMGSRKALVEAMGCTSQAPYRWPDPLSVGLTQRVIGAAWLLGRVRQINRVIKGE